MESPVGEFRTDSAAPPAPRLVPVTTPTGVDEFFDYRHSRGRDDRECRCEATVMDRHGESFADIHAVLALPTCQPVQLGTAGTLPTQLFGVLAVIGVLVVVMVPLCR